MQQEEKIKQELINKFSGLEANIRIPRAKRIFVEVSTEKFMEVFKFAATQLKFSHLCTITGLDEPGSLSFLYHLAEDSGIVLSIKISVPKENPVIKTVTAIFAGADIYEREVTDLLGAKVEGLASGNRYPLTDDWPKDQYPLRKDWKENA